MFGIFSLLGLVLVVLYVYVGVAIFRAEYLTGAGLMTTLSKAISWPVTIWHTIEKLYKVNPDDERQGPH